VNLPVASSPDYPPYAPYAPPVPPAPPEEQGVPWGRLVAALLRYKWLIVGIVALGGAAGLFISRRVRPEYEVRGTIWVTAAATQRQDRGPIRAQELLNSTGWVELLRSYAISDAVVRRLSLYIWPATLADTTAFRGFALADEIRPGTYTLRTDATGTRFTLHDQNDAVIEQGAVGDSVGRALGFRWRPAADVLGRNRSVRFRMVPPRQASVDLAQKFSVTLPENSTLMRVSLRGSNPNRVAATMNAWLEEFVLTATKLKKANLVQLAEVLQEQLQTSEVQLRTAERALEEFRIVNITRPSENGPVAAGVEATRDPVLTSFFEQKVEHDRIRRDREALERLLAASQAGTPLASSLMSVPSVLQSSDELRTALTELSTRQAQLRAARQIYTEEHRMVRDLREGVAALETQTIPAMARETLDRLQRREADLSTRIAGASRELQNIPSRTIEEMRLRRDVAVSENLYTTLQARYAEAKLAEAGAVPDVRVLDSAVVPLIPNSNTGPRLLFIVVAASMGFAVMVALLLDRLDRTFRYPEQATRELGLDIVGFVPTMRDRGKRGPDPLDAAQLVESFRSMRLHLQHLAQPDQPVLVTISSAGAGEGKSLVASNLALAFADAGHRTLLIDGDVRRGGLHATFDVPQRPGLTEYLQGKAPLAQVVRPVASTSGSLAVLPRGTAIRRGPELLASQAFTRLVAELRPAYDAIIVDSAPLGAGMDAFALGATTGQMLIVLRAGVTDRRLASAKLKVLDRLPVAIAGAVLNDVKAEGAYRYYSYLPGYDEAEEPDAVLATDGAGMLPRGDRVERGE